MPSSELYTPQKGMQLESVTLPDLHGQPITTNSIFAADHISDFAFVTMKGSKVRTPTGESQKPISLARISPDHKRSSLIIFTGFEDFAWEDGFGNIASAMTLKGNNFENPKIFDRDIEPSGFAVWGLQDSEALLRVLKVSDVLRKEHIPTENIARVMVPRRYPYQGQLLSEGSFKQALKERYRRTHNKDEDFTPEKDQRMSAYIDNTLFVITVREMPVAERLQDYRRAKSKKKFLELVGKTFCYINFEEKQKSLKDPEYAPISFDISCPDDIYRYFTEYLPARLGESFGKLHNMGLLHGFPHAGNLPTIGGFVDLDSVRGESLGMNDKPVTHEEKEIEVSSLYDHVGEVIYHLIDARYITSPQSEVEGIKLREDTIHPADKDNPAATLIYKAFKKLVANFTRPYLHNATDTFNVIPLASLLDAVYDIMPGRDPEMFAILTENAIRNLGWDYSHSEKLSDMPDIFLQYAQKEIYQTFEQLSQEKNGQDSEEKYNQTLDTVFGKKPDMGNFWGFLVIRINNAIKNERKEQVEHAEKQYGQKEVATVINWISLKEAARMSTKEGTRELEEQVKEMIQHIIEKTRETCLKS